LSDAIASLLASMLSPFLTHRGTVDLGPNDPSQGLFEAPVELTGKREPVRTLYSSRSAYRPHAQEALVQFDHLLAPRIEFGLAVETHHGDGRTKQNNNALLVENVILR